MAIDFEALKAKLRAQANANNTEEVKQNETTSVGNIPNTDSDKRDIVDINNSGQQANVPSTVTAPAVLGTAKTTEIDHIDFLSKMNKLAEAIHTKHPTMPVLLMQIHKQLRADPELVTTLDEDAIGIIVTGLQIQTKTELVTTVVKESRSKAKKIAISTDML